MCAPRSDFAIWHCNILNLRINILNIVRLKVSQFTGRLGNVLFPPPTTRKSERGAMNLKIVITSLIYARNFKTLKAAGKDILHWVPTYCNISCIELADYLANLCDLTCRKPPDVSLRHGHKKTCPWQNYIAIYENHIRSTTANKK